MIPNLPIKMAKHFLNVSQLKKLNKNWRSYVESYRRLVEKKIAKAMMMDDTVNPQRKQKRQTLLLQLQQRVLQKECKPQCALLATGPPRAPRTFTIQVLMN